MLLLGITGLEFCTELHFQRRPTGGPVRGAETGTAAGRVFSALSLKFAFASVVMVFAIAKRKGA